MDVNRPGRRPTASWTSVNHSLRLPPLSPLLKLTTVTVTLLGNVAVLDQVSLGTEPSEVAPVPPGAGTMGRQNEG